MSNARHTVFPDWSAILELKEPGLADFIMRGNADRHSRMSLGWPDLFTAKNPYADEKPIPLATLQREFNTFSAGDPWNTEKTWNELGRKLNFPIFIFYNERYRRDLGDIAVSEVAFNRMAETYGAI